MTEEKKRAIAEWMGLAIRQIFWTFYDKPIFEFQRKKFHSWKDLKHFNPDTNTDQFIEVLKHMSGDELREMDFILESKLVANVADGVINRFIWLSDHKPQVIDALYTIITTTKD